VEVSGQLYAPVAFPPGKQLLVSIIQSVPGGNVSILEIIVSVILRTCALFRTVSEIELFERTVAKLLIRKRYYVLFLIFIVQVTNL
jgi:hypothetical protein